MIAFNSDGEDELEEKPAGVLGDGALHPGKYNMALVRRAIRNDYPISPEIRKALVEQMHLVMECSDDQRNQIGAAKVLIFADAINAKREAMDQADELKKSPTIHLHAHKHVHDLSNDELLAIASSHSANGGGGIADAPQGG